MTLSEHELSDLLTERAADAPGAEGLLQAVHARSRRRARRRNAAGAVAAVAAVAVLAVSAGVVAGSPTGRGEEVLAWQEAERSGFLVAVDLRPSFPLTPGYLPPGLHPEPRLSAERGTRHAEWERAEAGQDGPLSALSISVSATAPDQDGRTAPTPVDVDGATAALRRYEGSTAITWQRRPQQWVHVSGFAPVTEAQALSVARSLRDEPVQQEASFELDVTPAGHVLAEHRRTGLTLGPADGEPSPQDDPRAVVVAVRRAGEATDRAGTPVRVGERSGWLHETDERFRLVLRIDRDLRLDVSTPATGRWNREELARFVDGITYSGELPRDEG